MRSSGQGRDPRHERARRSLPARQVVREGQPSPADGRTQAGRRPVHYTGPMEGFYSLDTLVLLLVAVLVFTALARRILIPDPIFLVLGGLALSFVPRLPVVPLDPDIVFLIFLPPILWSAAYFTSLRDFRLNLRPITLLAVGLVVVTTVAVAAVARGPSSRA